MRRPGGAWEFSPAPWLLAAPLVVLAGGMGNWALAVGAAISAVVVARSVRRPPG